MTSKKVLMLLGSVCLALMLVMPLVAGCPAPTPKAVRAVTIGGAEAGGTYAIIAEAMAKLLNDKAENILANVEATVGGGDGNLRLLAAKKLELGLAVPPPAYDIYLGIGDWAEEKNPDLRTFLLGIDYVHHVVVHADSPIRTVFDLKGKTMATGSAGNLLRYVPELLAAHGIQEGDYELSAYSMAESVSLLRDFHVDAWVCLVGAPATVVVDLASQKELRLIEIDPSALPQLPPFYSKAVIPAQSYPGQDAAVNTAGFSCAIYTHAGVDEQLVYEMAKTILENPDTLKEIHPIPASFTLKRLQALLEGGEPVPPYHEGVKRYLREVGIVS